MVFIPRETPLEEKVFLCVLLTLGEIAFGLGIGAMSTCPTQQWDGIWFDLRVAEVSVNSYVSPVVSVKHRVLGVFHLHCFLSPEGKGLMKHPI